MTTRILTLSTLIAVIPTLVHAHSGPIGQSPTLHASAHLMELVTAGFALGVLLWLGLRATRKRS